MTDDETSPSKGMRLSELREEWKQDAPIDISNLALAQVGSPGLHAKWLDRLSAARLLRRKAEVDSKRYRVLRERYYRGQMGREELELHGWSQWQYAVPLKDQMENLIQSDDTMIQHVNRSVYIETMIEFIEYVLKSLTYRSNEIKNAIEWIKITQGL